MTVKVKVQRGGVSTLKIRHILANLLYILQLAFVILLKGFTSLMVQLFFSQRNLKEILVESLTLHMQFGQMEDLWRDTWLFSKIAGRKVTPSL